MVADSNSIAQELHDAGDRTKIEVAAATHKKNYAERLSRGLANRFAGALRPTFPGILPDAAGRQHESRARTSKGFKKLDVNYSTLELGLGLGVSIKTINFRDAKTKRYTKNYTRADGELRAEASDYHDRQPYAVMVAVIFLPADSCDDGSARNPSSFGQAVQIFRGRAGRGAPTESPVLFERVFIGLYETRPERFGDVVFFDVMESPPRVGPPGKSLRLADVVAEIGSTYDERNNPVFKWADAPPEHVEPPPAEDDPEE